MAESPRYRVEGRAVPDRLVAPLTDSNRLLADPPALRRRLAADGYLYLSGALDRAAAMAARREVFERLVAVGEARPPAIDGLATGTSRRTELAGDLGTFWRSVSDGRALRRVTHGEALGRIAEIALDAPVRAFDFLWLRAMPVGRASPLHFDHVYMNRGTDRVVTAWLPLGDVPAEDGPLVLIEGSNRFDDLIAAYRGHDVDRDPSRPGYLPDDAVTLAEERGCRLLTAEFRAGDMVLLGMFTLHGSFDNVSPLGRIRLSCDVRYQPAGEPVDDRWFGLNPTGHGGKGYAALSSAQALTAPQLRR